MTAADTVNVRTLTEADVQGVKAWLYAPASSNLRVLAWVVVMLGLFVLLVRIGKAAARAWTVHRVAITEWIGTAPTTPLRLLVGIGLAVVFVLGNMVAMVLGIDLQTDTILAVGGFILIQMGLDVAHYGVKRATFKPEAMGLSRESIDPAASPAAAVVAATAQPVPTPAPAVPLPPIILPPLTPPAQASDLPVIDGEGD